MGVAYPITDSKTAERAIITIHAVNGDFVARITDDYPNGYTMFDISKLARGIYLYKITVRYADGTEDIHKYRKFSVIK